jgi:hypothetical protein
MVGACKGKRLTTKSKLNCEWLYSYIAVFMSGEVWCDPCTTYTTGIRRRIPALRACCSVEGWLLNKTASST